MHRAGLGLVDERPISYLGVAPETSVLFSLTLLTSATLFLMFGYFVKRVLQGSRKFWAFLIIGQIGQLIAAVVPYGDNSQYRLIHTLAAYTLAFSLPLHMWEFTRSQERKPHHQLYTRLFYLELVLFIIGIGIFSFTEGIAPLGEAMPTLGFHAWIIALTIVASIKIKPSEV
jgi:hypothetical protein